MPVDVSTGEKNETNADAKSAVTSDSRSHSSSSNSNSGKSNNDQKKKRSVKSKSKTSSKMSKGMFKPERVVDYRNNPTPLFQTVEGGEWDLVKSQIASHPAHVRTWVRSFDPESSFAWSQWRRLPIHEACRRQPPPHVIEDLLADCPESAESLTHFGEMPIHCAVGCGASSKIINLLIAFYPRALLHRDDGGRTPMEIFLTRATMDADDDNIRASMERMMYLLAEEKRVQEEIDEKARLAHIKDIEALNAMTIETVRGRDQTINDFKKKLEKSKSQKRELLETIGQYEFKIAEVAKTEHRLTSEITMLMGQRKGLSIECAELKDELAQTTARDEDKKDRINKLTKTVEALLLEMQEMVNQNQRTQRASKAIEDERRVIGEKQRRLNLKGKKRLEMLRKSALKIATETVKLTGTDSKTFRMDFVPQEHVPPAVSPEHTPDKSMCPAPHLSREGQQRVANAASDAIKKSLE